MSPDELKQAYYELALAEIEHRAATKQLGKPTDWKRYRKLAKLLCLDDVTLYEASLIIKTSRGNIYKHKFKFVDCRPRNNLNQGNRLKVSYSKDEKLEILALKESGMSYAEVIQETGVCYNTLYKWVLQKAAGKLI